MARIGERTLLTGLLVRMPISGMDGNVRQLRKAMRQLVIASSDVDRVGWPPQLQRMVADAEAEVVEDGVPTAKAAADAGGGGKRNRVSDEELRAALEENGD